MRRRKTVLKQRKDFLPTFIVTVLLWILVGLIIYLTDPSATGMVPLFFVVIFTTLLFTLSTLLANTKRGVIVAASLTAFLILRYFGVGNILNFLLILGIAIAAELYFN